MKKLGTLESQLTRKNTTKIWFTKTYSITDYQCGGRHMRPVLQIFWNFRGGIVYK